MRPARRPIGSDDDNFRKIFAVTGQARRRAQKTPYFGMPQLLAAPLCFVSSIPHCGSCHRRPTRAGPSLRSTRPSRYDTRPRRGISGIVVRSAGASRVRRRARRRPSADAADRSPQPEAIRCTLVENSDAARRKPFFTGSPSRSPITCGRSENSPSCILMSTPVSVA